MSVSISIARPYAQAIFDLAKENDAYDQWLEGLTMAAIVAEDQEVAALVTDPAVSSDELHALLFGICGESLPTGGGNFLKLLVQNDRVESLPGIAAQFAELVDLERRTVTADVVSAQQLTDEQRKSLLDALEMRLGRTVSLSESVDETLVGGAIVRAGDLVIDGSASGRLGKLAAVLTR
ncbi:MAG: F0F1 ATP synthase subunit delta [Proteobacteria bacterium]|jgi:F-type H+-transporting ATPase subunit delta|nr:F0F1 ATP synthase subunit delta [Pseudomonadota bacterium]